jgi:hypothetical protein
MKIMPSPSIHHFLARVGICLIVATLIVGIAGCGEGDPENGNYYNLTIASTYGGSVTTPGESESWYAANTTVELVAESDDHHQFVNWAGDVSNIADVYAPATNVTMNDHYFITANFEPDEGWYYLTIDSTYGGSVIEPGEGYFAYAANTTIDLVAKPDEHCHFVNWTGNVDTIADVDAAATNITMFESYCITANFGPFAGGSGTAEDPYQIADWYQLDSVRDYPSSHFILINDLDSTTAGYTKLASPTANGGKGWAPIGRVLDPFTWSFDGQGYKIRDLYINRPLENYVGLFGIIGEGWQIEEIGVVDVTVLGQAYVGGLVGGNYLGIVSNCYATGIVHGSDHVGGLVGFSYEGTVSNSYYTGSVTGDSFVGGLVGDNWGGTVSNSYSIDSVSGRNRVGGLVGQSYDGTISNSHSTGSVTGIEDVGGLVGWHADIVRNSYSSCNVTGIEDVGGLVGDNYIPSTISNSYSTGSVTGDSFVGGLVGDNDHGTVSNSYSTGDVTGGWRVGGLVGENSQASVSNSYSTGSVSGNSLVGGLAGWTHDSTVSNSYSTGSVTGNENVGGLAGGIHLSTVSNSYSSGSVYGSIYVGGLVGRNWYSTVSNSFWDTQTSGQSSSDGGTGKTTAQMKSIATFSGAAWDITEVGGPGEHNPTYIWNIVDAVTYPFLSWQS